MPQRHMVIHRAVKGYFFRTVQGVIQRATLFPNLVKFSVVWTLLLVILETSLWVRTATNLIKEECNFHS